MKGAREYATLFPGNNQYGKLFLLSGSHARGKTFHIYVLPDETKIDVMPWQIKNSVEVYGILGGQNGWTEYYGWIHDGKWVEDFKKIVEDKRKEVSERNKKEAALKQEKIMSEKQNQKKLLSNY